MSGEIDLGHLSAEERALVEPRSEEEREESWLRYALDTAERLRKALVSMPRGTPQYADLNYRRHRAIETARKHIARLRNLCYLFPADLEGRIAAEGLR